MSIIAGSPIMAAAAAAQPAIRSAFDVGFKPVSNRAIILSSRQKVLFRRGMQKQQC